MLDVTEEVNDEQMQKAAQQELAKIRSEIVEEKKASQEETQPAVAQAPGLEIEADISKKQANAE